MSDNGTGVEPVRTARGPVEGIRAKLREERIRLRLDWQRWAKLLGVSFGGLYKIAGPSGTTIPQATRAAELEEQLKASAQMTPEDAVTAIAGRLTASAFVRARQS